MSKRKDAYEIFNDVCKQICLLHLIAVGEFAADADLRDSTQYFYDVREDCSNCEHNKTCLACTFTSVVQGV